MVFRRGGMEKARVWIGCRPVFHICHVARFPFISFVVPVPVPVVFPFPSSFPCLRLFCNSQSVAELDGFFLALDSCHDFLETPHVVSNAESIASIATVGTARIGFRPRGPPKVAVRMCCACRPTHARFFAATKWKQSILAQRSASLLADGLGR